MSSERFPAKIVYNPEGSYPISIPVAKTALSLAATGALTVTAAFAAWWYAPVPLRRLLPIGLPLKSQRFQLLVEIEFEKAEELQTFKEIWTELAQYVAKYEPKTLIYELLEADTKQGKIVILERYTDKAALTEIHQKSQAYKTFQRKISEANFDMSKGGQSYFESGLGYV